MPEANELTEAEKAAAEAATAAAAAAAAAAAVPAKPAAAAAPATPAAKGRGAPAKIEIPSDEFAKRVSREARSLLRRKVGTDDLEEITALVERGRKAAPAAPAVPGAPAAAAGPDPETARLRAKLAERDAQLEEEKKRRRRIKDKAHANEVELRLRHTALAAGVNEGDVDYALDRYKKDFVVAPEGKRPLPSAYWGELRKKQPFLFTGAAPAPAAPVPLSPTTSPPEGAAAGEAPKPAGAAAPRVEVDVEKLDQKTFDDRTQGRYGYRPQRVA